jgi:GTPase SAR1 family protein
MDVRVFTAADLSLSAVVEDLAVIRAAYEKAGLLAADAPSAMALKLLGNGEDTERFRRDFLLLDALLRQRVARVFLDGGELRHLVVFGGTNVGKSTVVNILAGASIASSSPEGAHTQHAQVFSPEPLPITGRNHHAFRGFKVGPHDPLTPCKPGAISRSQLMSDLLPRDVAVWDTPDCDSTHASHYVGAVIEALALADVVLYVTSIEKYTVADIVEWVFQLNAAGVPIVECLNKTPRKDRETVIRRQREATFPKASEQLGLLPPDPPIVALRYLVDGEDSDLWGPDHPEAAELRKTVIAALAKTDRHEAGRAALAFVRQHLHRVCEPIRMEIDARTAWDTAVDDAVRNFVSVYESSYLTSAKVIEPFARLNLELLHLIDPDTPGLKQALQFARKAALWQSTLLRKGLSLIKQIVKESGEKGERQPPELKAYSEAHVEVVNAMGRLINSKRASPPYHPFWEVVDQEWRAQADSLSEEFAGLVQTHMENTDRQIKAAARDVFTELEKNPQLLRKLRAARMAADAGGLIAAFTVPHLGLVHGMLHDLVMDTLLGNVMISATEKGAEVVAKSYIERRRRKLVDDLLQEARKVADELYGHRLRAIAKTAMARSGALGVGGEIVERLDTNLAALKV